MPSAKSQPITVRRVQERDVQGLASVLTPDVGANQVAQRWREHCYGYREMLVAEMDGQMVGTVSLGGHKNQRPGSLRMFALDVGSSYRRRGIGTALIAAVEEEARRRGIGRVHLEVSAENSGAIRLYEHLGYELEGDPILDRWWRLKDDGSHEMIEEVSHLMSKMLQ